MQTNPRLLPWFALVFFALLTVLAGMMLVGQNAGSSNAQTGNLPKIDLNNLFGVTR